MSEFLDRISKLSPSRVALLADELNERVLAAENGRRVPLAIVGIGCRLPGGVDCPDAFWRLLSDGVDAIGEVPATRWDIDEFYDSNPDAPGKMATRWGGFIDGADQFDPKFFGIAPTEAASMDPQQRLLLETAWEALEHAGVPPRALMDTRTGVYVGICNADYSKVAFQSPREQITPHIATGLSHAVAAGRISYVLGLQGPSLAVDTACSASLVAVHLACQSLRLGECDAAIAGGVNLILDPDVTIALSRSRMMAPDGKCKAFSDSANGFVRGEGCGMIVLKRLPDAIRERNRVLAVIRGSACNQDGRSSGLTAPNGPSQELVVRSALADADISTNEVGYVEAHGTGTSLGDPIELGALNSVFAGRPPHAGPLYIGSVKTNIGHLESAAGIAGLIKLVLSLQHGKIPATLHLDKPNSRVEWDRLPLEIPKQLQDWKPSGDRRVGGVSSFGFSGTNAHVIVEEYPSEAPHITRELADPAREISEPGHPLLFPLSAMTGSALTTIITRLADHLVQHPSLSLADIAHTLNSGRSHFDHRAAFVAASRTELLDLLRRWNKSDPTVSVHTGRAAAHPPRFSFIFGDGEDLGLKAARTLYQFAPSFRESLMHCLNTLQSDRPNPLASLVSRVAEARDGAKGFDNRNVVPMAERAPTAFALQYALAEMWRSCGVEPSAVWGLGVGELVAKCVAGVFSVEDGLRLAMAREREDDAAFAKRSRAVSHDQPRIPVVPNAEADSAANVLSMLRDERCTANLVIGDSSFLRSIEGFGVPLEANWLVSLDERCDTLRQIMATADALYVLGCDLDMGCFYGSAANIVSLPTYPFERERYWLSDGGSVRDSRREVVPQNQLGHSGSDLERGAEEWVYELAWEPKPFPSQMGPNFAAVPEEETGQQNTVHAATEDLNRIARLHAAATPVYATLILHALREAGLDAPPRSSFLLEELANRLKVSLKRRRILGRVIEILEEDKLVERVDGRFRFVDFSPRPDADAELQRLANEYPECRIELEILRRCGENLSAVLRGTYDPMQLVFADGSIEEAEQIYEKSPPCRFFNGKAAETVRAAVDKINRSEGRCARILEIGAGTGATTSPVLAALAGSNSEYCFTDISPVFLSRARSKFSDVPALSYRTLNIERDPTEQGFSAGEFDIVLAANVLHATADLRDTVANVRKLLAPGGLIVLLEGIRPDRWLDLTFGLTDGWWRFVDFDLRPKHPMMSAETWARVFDEAGIGPIRTISYTVEDGSTSQQVVIAGRANRVGMARDTSRRLARGSWTIFADKRGVGAALAELLTNRGERVEAILRPDAAEEVSQVLETLRKSSDQATAKAVYLWGLDVPDQIATTDALQAGTELSGKVLVHLIQVLQKRGINGSRLYIATRGAQATERFSPTTGEAVQSLAWGLGRTLGLEAPERYGAIVDLDPSSSAEAAAENLQAELFSDDGEDQIAYRNGQRFVARLRRTRLTERAEAPSNVLSLREDGSYLLVGGLGGLGLLVAKWAAERRAKHLVLLGRTGTGNNASEFARERRDTIAEIERLGAQVVVVEADVALRPEMDVLFEKFNDEFPPLHGVFYAPTVGGASELGDLPDELMDAMMRSKVQGAWVLHEKTKNLALDFFVAFSSTTSLLGAARMGHYAAANQFLDSFAHCRRAAGLPMIAVNWGAWETMRLASPEAQARLRETGLLPMSADKALRFLGEAIQSRRAQVMVANIDWSVLRPIFETQRRRPLLEHLGDATPAHRKDFFADIPQEFQLDRAAMLGSADRGKFIELFVMEQSAQVLGLRRGELPPVDIPLTDLGLDSLMAVDLKNRLQKGLGQELSPTVVFDYPTVSAMTEMLDTMLWASHGSGSNSPEPAQKDEVRI